MRRLDEQELLDLVLSSGLVGEAELATACADFLRESLRLKRERTFDSLCEFLVSSNRLTQWQCDRLKERRWKGFFLDQYKLLNILTVDDDYTYYLAEEVATSHQVRLKISPKSRVPPKDGKPHYEVLEL